MGMGKLTCNLLSAPIISLFRRFSENPCYSRYLATIFACIGLFFHSPLLADVLYEYTEKIDSKIIGANDDIIDLSEVAWNLRLRMSVDVDSQMISIRILEVGYEMTNGSSYLEYEPEVLDLFFTPLKNQDVLDSLRLIEFTVHRETVGVNFGGKFFYGRCWESLIATIVDESVNEEGANGLRPGVNVIIVGAGLISKVPLVFVDSAKVNNGDQVTIINRPGMPENTTWSSEFRPNKFSVVEKTENGIRLESSGKLEGAPKNDLVSWKSAINYCLRENLPMLLEENILCEMKIEDDIHLVRNESRGLVSIKEID